jgi:lipopolysaccharide/colanic/teichoic acid biosynthesis glycosyltransferase
LKLNGQKLVITYAKNKSYYLFIKQLLDFVFSTLSLIALLPLIVVFSTLIKLNSPGPIFYKQERIGVNGQSFFIIKFRTMDPGAETDGPRMAQINDSRITTVGRFLRRYRFDEIPQFINIIRGEMSFIGPRPERLFFIKNFERDIPNFRSRLQVKPGITGWAQINGGYDLTPKEKLKLDLYYIDNFSVLLDLKITIKSIPIILFAKGWR